MNDPPTECPACGMKRNDKITYMHGGAPDFYTYYDCGSHCLSWPGTEPTWTHSLACDQVKALKSKSC